MSIRLRSGGHSFPLENIPQPIAGQGVECNVLTLKTILVPNDVFDPQDAAQYLVASGLACDPTEVAVYSDLQQPIVAVMAMDQTCAAMIHARCGQDVAFTSPLLWQPKNCTASVWMYGIDGLLYLKIYRESLRFAEVFSADSPADASYYLALLDREFSFKKDTVYVAEGSFDWLIKEVKPYFKHIVCE
ncbi:MAG: hypothetical protein RR330_06495 [Alistipes sp.]